MVPGAHIISDGTLILNKRCPMAVRCVCFNDEIPKYPSTKETRMTKPEAMATDCTFGFRISDFLRIWVFRHSDFRAHQAY